MGKLTEVKINIATAIAAAFGFVIALLWRDVIGAESLKNKILTLSLIIFIQKHYSIAER